MNEEMKNYEANEEIEVVEVELDEEPETSGNGILGKIVIGGLGVLATVGGVLWYKNKDKINEKRKAKRIRKLEQEGYIVYKPEPSENTVNVDFEDCEDAE